MNVAQETLGFRRAGLSPALSLLMSAFALLIPPATLTGHLRRPTERSPTMHAFPLIHSGCRARLEPQSDKPSIEASGRRLDFDGRFVSCCATGKLIKN